MIDWQFQAANEYRHSNMLLLNFKVNSDGLTHTTQPAYSTERTTNKLPLSLNGSPGTRPSEIAYDSLACLDEV